MNEYYFSLYLSYSKCLDYYHGKYKSVQVTEDGGKTVRFDAEHLRPFISSIGIRGRFRLILTEQNRFLKLEKVS
ncbi:MULTISPECIES: DUF2835 domain-containing protein [Pseudoalteromonas]|jgi:hypothetical protein|uniref:DUF2835 domain-containing protein n=1 Tax=Pseudoalteromonas TaxID=53246 RepID=UPI000780F877|nr:MULTISPECIES: DUF2835 domain-containing protein [Gammaproteobacteria]MCF7499335.1 DUF2835 domain-containing protein [Pseudoalteromonas sp. L1]MCF7519214.1 DUF2835 domain-containing protein [Pseudoalteromonas sp. L21]UJX27020.1 DUF2835 domain-containing protein [Pseudoalteromonas sp. CF6-2]WOC27761.1 DUF2835 domain-containing protein [Pseudoalteromonas sp. N1230-9]|tara:strand:- start:160 stop:381 length:222 start_codon:yes stop_codon:yes gene_type:complete